MAKRKLSNIDFSKEGAHVALVHKDQGGAANNCNYALVLKSSKISEEYVEKIQQIQVTLEFPEFLQKFFGLWYEDAEVLARLLGYEEPVDDSSEPEDWWENYLLEKLKSFTILKSLNESKNLAEDLAKLDEKSALQIKKDQALVEKAWRKQERLEKKMRKENAKGTTPDASNNTGKTNMSEKLEDVQKSLADAQAELQKARDEVASFKAKEAEAVLKSKTSKVAAVVKDKKYQPIILKAGLALADEDFGAFVESIEAIYKQVEQSAMFRETGASVEGTAKPVENNGLATLLKNKYSNK